MKKFRYAAELPAAALLLLCVLLSVLIHRNPGFTRYANAVPPFSAPKPDSVTEEAIPDYAGVRRTYVFTLPETGSLIGSGARFSVYLRHTIAAYAIDGSFENDLAEEAAPHIGRTPGSYWVSIPMRAEYAGKTLRLTLTPVYANVRDAEPVFLIITRDALLHMIVMPEDGLMLALSLFAVFAGLFLALAVLLLPLDGEDKRRVFYLGAVTVAAGLWKLCGLPVLTLLLEHWGIQKELWFTGAACYLLMLVCSLRLLAALRTGEKARVSMLCFYLGAAVAAALLLGQMLGALELHQALVPFGVGMALLHGVSLLGCRPGRSELLWLLPFFLALGADLAICLISGSMRGAPVFLIWITLNLLVRGVSYVRGAILRERLLRRREAELRDEKLRALMGQIRPHFIYNTLASVYELCRDAPEEAMRVIEDFTDYLQANFTAISATEPIAFSEELKHTRAYLGVETALHGDDLSVEYDTETTAFLLPPLTLQPLVENAVKHGIDREHRRVEITIRTRFGSGGVRLTVENSGADYAPQEAPGDAQIGLQNVRERLDLMCGGSLTLSPRPGGGTVAEAWIPVRSPDVPDKAERGGRLLRGRG